MGREPAAAGSRGPESLPQDDGGCSCHAGAGHRWSRRARPIRCATACRRPRLTFGEGLVGPLAGHERRVIRYRVVRLLDSPDELRGAEIGYLDQGDEVQLLEKYGAYWLVISPDGQQGWLHRMVLGEIVEPASRTAADVPVATMPTVADRLDDGRIRRGTATSSMLT